MSTFLTTPDAPVHAAAAAASPEPREPARPAWDPRGWTWRRRLAGLAALWLLSGIYIVPTDEQAVVTRWGAVVDARVRPGIHVALPWPVDRVIRLKVRQLQRTVVGGEPGDAALGRFEDAAAQFLTGDQNLIQLRAAVQYSVTDPAAYLFAAEDVGRAVRAAVEAELARQVARRGVDAVLTTEKAAIQEAARARGEEVAKRYGLGVHLASVSIELAAPPPEAREAFNDVASARADSARIVNEAQGYAGDVVPKARGEAQQLLQAAAGYRLRKVNEARGDAERFTQVAGEYARAAALNGRRLYMEAMEEVLPRIRKLLVDSRGNVDLTILRRGEPAPAK